MNEDMMNFADLLATNDDFKPFLNAIEEIMAIPEDNLNDETVEIIIGMTNGALTKRMREETINEIINNFEEENLTKATAKQRIEASKILIQKEIDKLNPSEQKRNILEGIFSIFYEIYNEVLERYHNYNIELPIKLDDGATVPTYAHDTDACADLYAADDMVLSAHTFSNMVRTGVHIALPEGWMAMIFPRSSIGAKTQNRLSNSVGIIDSEYRGQLGVLYDNLSDSDYFIKTGDRIAQMLVMPSYKFKANVVDILPASSRGEGGFGSTGK